MSPVLRSLQLLAIAFWVGGIAFFAFVPAPSAFHTLPSPQEAGSVVRASILGLHRIGIACAAIFLIAWVFAIVRKRLQLVLVATMLGLTLFSQFYILPKMDRDRLEAREPIEMLSLDDMHRVDFDRLHARSEQVEGGVLLCGIAVLILIACESRVIEL